MLNSDIRLMLNMGMSPEQVALTVEVPLFEVELVMDEIESEEYDE